jgi:penicillin-binding protein-related factor A (putative recombinase)
VRSGSHSEDLIAQQNQTCLLAGIARVHKIATPFKVIGEIGPFLKCARAKRSTVDYEGTMLDGTGRHIAIECKRCSTARFPFGRIEDHQRDELTAVHHAGGVAAVVLVYGPLEHVLTIPWQRMADLIASVDEASARADWLAPFRVPLGTPYLARFVRGREGTP